ncbi:MAG: hypothetical protein HYX69_08945 [Planctomycetia bacterium]|nr:hypothetical protein [Planctomycetia bacterium]
MPRQAQSEEDAFGSDSFLDVIANIVGILIVLVVVTGLRSQHAPREESAATKEAKAALAQAQSTTGALHRDVLAIEAEMQRVAATAAGRYEERAVLAQDVAQRQHELDKKRRSMTAASREQFDLERAVATAKESLDRLAREKTELDSGGSERIEVTAYPTPISSTVYGKEVHFQLKGGRAAPIPLDELLEKFKHQAQQKVYRLRDQPEFSDAVGPVDGFRLRYVVERVDVSVETQMQTGQGGSYAQLRQFTVIPMTSDLGEPAAEALSEQSRFRTTLVGRDPKRTTVTLWTYPDSFPLFRELRKELHRQGYSVAGRPLEDGQPIGGSPHGSKSAAQ